ncbi:MAG: hypothetical protein AAF577_17150, partial [Pseudomonadota bacterium]
MTNSKNLYYLDGLIKKPQIQSHALTTALEKSARIFRQLLGVVIMCMPTDLSPDFPPAVGRVLGLMSARYAAFSSSAICGANSAGGTFPRAECGR